MSDDLVAGFDAEKTEPMGEFTPIPDGKYKVIIASVESKETKSGNGKYLKVDMSVSGGEFDGRKLYSNLNLDNPNETAVKIARSELSSICRSIGVMHPNSMNDLLDGVMGVKVAVEERGDGKGKTNVIKAYFDASGVSASSPDKKGSDGKWMS